ncbi:hypothetical protein KRM28CT15_25910 [Krasilnikovia sp. M28-CT-15]
MASANTDHPRILISSACLTRLDYLQTPLLQTPFLHTPFICLHLPRKSQFALTPSDLSEGVGEQEFEEVSKPAIPTGIQGYSNAAVEERAYTDAPESLANSTQITTVRPEYAPPGSITTCHYPAFQVGSGKGR